MSSSTDTTNTPDPRRWLILAVIGIAQLMVVLDITIVNIALPSAQSALHFSDDGRQWIITAYALSFGSLLLLGGKLGDIFGRKATFIAGLIGFAVVSAVGGASVSFLMLVVARACQGAFGALLAPAALSLLTTTFRNPKERARAFGIFGAIASGGAAVGLLLGGLLTEYLSWRWCLYVNLAFALPTAAAAAPLLSEQRRPTWQRPDFFGVLTGGGSMFCLVYGFSNASTHAWDTPSTWGFLAAAAALLTVFVIREAKARNPLLPLSIVADRNRGGSALAILSSGAGVFGVFLFLTFYLQQTLGYSPVGAGLAFLPMVAMIMIFSNLANIVLLPRIGPNPLIPTGLLASAGAMVWLTAIGPHTSYVHDVLGPTLLIGAGFGLTFGSALNTGTFGVTAAIAGVASATLNTMQQIGGSIGTSLLNSVATESTKNFIAGHATAARGGATAAGKALTGQALVHGYTTAFWWSAAIFAGGAIASGAVLRIGPLGGGRPPGRHARGRPSAPDAIRSADVTRSADPIRSADVIPSADAIASADAIPHADIALQPQSVPVSQPHAEPETESVSPPHADAASQASADAQTEALSQASARPGTETASEGEPGTETASEAGTASQAQADAEPEAGPSSAGERRRGGDGKTQQ
jgi:EmrB/QacA subfamily drug resistance transporter